jgi:hypothetical protein
MLVGAFVAAFKIDNWTSFYYNIIPILLFMIVCFTCKSNIQVSTAFFDLANAYIRVYVHIRFPLRIVFVFRNLIRIIIIIVIISFLVFS